MTLCQHQERETNIWVCSLCGHVARTSAKPGKRECGQRPTLAQKAVNLGRAIIDTAADGFTKALPEVVTARLQVCHSCDQFDSAANSCGQCGCNLAYKPLMRAWDCPLGKWSKPDQFAPEGPIPLAPVPGATGSASAVAVTTRKLDGTFKIVLVAPCLHPLGGIERWLIAMSRYIALVSDGRAVVSTVVIQFEDTIDPVMLAELSRYTKVVSPDPTSSFRQAIRDADAVVISGSGDVAWCLEGMKKSPAVWLSHSCCDYSRRFCREAQKSGLITHFASVGHTAKGVFPDDLVPLVTAVENGAEVERCTPVRGRDWQRQEWGFTDSQIVIGYIGRLHTEKRPEALAEALAHLPSQYVGVIVGTGSHERETREICDRLAPGRIKFVGRMNLLGDAMAAMDVGLLASPAEGFCLGRVEMQLAGLPLVSTPTGEIPRLEAENGAVTHHIPIGATGQQMALAIQNAVEGLHIAIAANARRLAWGRYTAPAMAARWVDYLTSISSETEN